MTARGAFAAACAVAAACAAPAAAQVRTVTRVHPSGTDARVLERRIDVRVAPDGRATRFERRIVEFLSDFSLDAYADPVVLHDARFQRMRIDVARTTLPDGTTLDTPAIGVNELTLPELALAPAFAGIRETVVTHVGIEPGARAELAFTIEDLAPSPLGHVEGEVALRWAIPIERFELVVTVPAGTTLHHACVGCAIEPTVVDEAGSRTYAWRAEHLAAVDWLEVADHVGSPADGLEGPRIVYSTAPDWSTAVEPLRAAFGEAADPGDAVRAKALALTEDCATPGQRIEALQAFVAEGIAGVSLPAGTPAAPAAGPAEVLARSYGTPPEKAGLLAALLAAVGLEARVALLSGPGDVAAEVPCLSPFREAWVAAAGPAGEIWLPIDARAGSRGISARGGRTVLFVDDAAAGPRPAPRADVGLAEASVRMEIDAGGAIAAEVRLTLAGRQNPYAALRGEGDDPSAKLGKAAAALVPGGEPAATVVESFGIDGAAAAVEVDGRVAVEGRDAWVIALGWPGTDPWPAGMHRSSRETPLDLAAPFRRSVRCVVALPSGWEPAILPRAVRVDAAAGRFVQEVVVGGGEVRITRTLEIDAPRVEPAAYDGLRRIYLESVSAGAEPLVLRRTPSPP